MEKYEVESIVTGKVTGIEKYGIFVGFDDGYSGLVHISEVTDSFVRNLTDYVAIEELIQVRVLEIDEEKHHMKLSIKGINYRNKPKNRESIVETDSGFDPLKEKLDTWIEEKLIEISINEQKK